MIREITRAEIPECVSLIRQSFQTVADEFGFTTENAPRFTAFATTAERLEYQLREGRKMFAYLENGKIAGYYSFHQVKEGECELNNLCIHPEYRHRKIGEQLLAHAFSTAKSAGYTQIHIGIVEENKRLREWYERQGFIHLGTKKFEFFPFTCGYMSRQL